jgi:hypothetical protein
VGRNGAWQPRGRCKAALSQGSSSPNTPFDSPDGCHLPPPNLRPPRGPPLPSHFQLREQAQLSLSFVLICGADAGAGALACLGQCCSLQVRGGGGPFVRRGGQGLLVPLCKSFPNFLDWQSQAWLYPSQHTRPFCPTHQVVAFPQYTHQQLRDLLLRSAPEGADPGLYSRFLESLLLSATTKVGRSRAQARHGRRPGGGRGE